MRRDTPEEYFDIMVNKRDLELLFEIGSLSNVQKGSRQHFGIDCETVLEHTLRVMWLALILARSEGKGNDEKIMKMALVHDLEETRVSDLGYIQKVYVKSDEERAVSDSLTGTSLSDLSVIFQEYKKRDSIEAKLVKDADNLELDIEFKELEDQGSKLPAKLVHLRKLVRDEKLYTDSAKALWDELQTAEVHDWHLKTNKWIKMPDCGR